MWCTCIDELLFVLSLCCNGKGICVSVVYCCIVLCVLLVMFVMCVLCGVCGWSCVRVLDCDDCVVHVFCGDCCCFNFVYVLCVARCVMPHMFVSIVLDVGWPLRFFFVVFPCCGLLYALC